jgi:quercetin dioxygenase-like cupin family protein
MELFKKSEIYELKELVKYQEGTIVSKTLINKENGTITIFAFDQGQSLSEHIAPFDALVHIIEGKAEIKIMGKKFNLKKGEIIIMPANKSHAVKAINNFKMILTLIK